MAQAKAELEYDRFKSLASAAARPADADFDQAVKQVRRLPKQKKPGKNHPQKKPPAT